MSAAVVIYTSGSTGEPKGVVHSHASLSTMAFARSRVKVYWNYGSSETLMVLVGCVNEGGILNSGHALQCCRCYLVSDDGLPVTPREASQLIIKSHTNFIGYLRDGKVHASKRGLGCYLVGRLNYQLKILGQRFKPEEVENKLLPALGNVKELAVTVATLKGNVSRPALVVLVILKQPSITDRHSIALSESSFKYLVQALPSYMIPIRGLSVDKLLRLPNGKLNRRSLISLAEQGTLTELIDLRPTTKRRLQDYDVTVADMIALVWANVLGLEVKAINSTSSFFLLGGNSLYTLRVCKELRAVGVLLLISDFFLYPTLEAIVHLVAAQSRPQPNEPQRLPPRSQSVAQVDANELFAIAAEQCGVDERLIEEVFLCTPMQAALMTLSEVQDGTYVTEHIFRLQRTWTKTAFLRA
ncbi:putative HC-toxin synthetase [Colletotrichum sublineola]|uniref:Putative HC-toxin synthetase n=1 Tax=Colletotrichum sublineola TaxID=1173701 RepID=A0A066X2X9_COLSU|nr:putative HC-toxin synthetase [Colletotrichum sublineola]